MFGPYKCRCCGEVFNEPHTYYESHGFTDGRYELQSCCPCCGGDYEEFFDLDEFDDEEVDEAE